MTTDRGRLSGKAEASVGARVRTRDGQVGVVQRLFETPWDTVNQGAEHTRTVAHIEGDGVLGEWFADQLEVIE